MQAILTLQLRVLGALVLRETRATFGSSQIGYLWAIVTPAAGVAILVAIFSSIGRQSPFDSSLALFFATGILTLEMFQKLGNSLMNVFNANKALLTYPLIKETDVFLARAILVGATYALIMVIVYSGLVALNLAGSPANLEDMIAAFSITFLLGAGFGASNAVILSVWESWRYVESVLTRPLFFLSGVFYVPSYLPTQAVEWLKWNPVLHCVEWMRNGYYSNYNSMVLDKGYVILVALLLILFGLAGERFTRARRSGA